MKQMKMLSVKHAIPKPLPQTKGVQNQQLAEQTQTELQRETEEASITHDVGGDEISG